MAYVTSPNMLLQIPGVGTESGPQYATDVNNSLTIIDSHNHSNGSGVQITPSGLNINATLPIQNQVLQSIGVANLYPQATTPTVLQSLYSEGLDLYYVDGSGNAVRLTQSGSIVGTAGSITGLPSGTASASYASSTFVFQSATSTAANVDGGSFILRNNTASSYGLTLSPPNSLGFNYSITFPLLPTQTNVMTLDTSGNMSSITYNQVGTNITTLAENVSSGGQLVVTSIAASFGNQLGIIRGYVGANGTIIAGEGFLASRTGLGTYTISFAPGFNDTPAVTITPVNNTVAYFAIITQSPAPTFAGFSLYTRSEGAGNQDCSFMFTAIGQRQ